MNSTELITALQLSPHVEGGYYRRIYTHPCSVAGTDTKGSASSQEQPCRSSQRPLMSSIYYLLSRDRPIGHLHRNRSDILHFFLQGAPLHYTLLWPDGRLQHIILGHRIDQGEQQSLLVPGGVWKASQLVAGEYGLIAEAVCPGFVYEDMTLATHQYIQDNFPQHLAVLSPLIHSG